MAIITYSDPSEEIQGVRGGVLFSQNRTGFIAKARVKPATALSLRKMPRLSIFSELRGRWRDVLDAGERTDWTVLGALTFWENGLGKPYSPNGFNLFIRTNALRMFYDLSFINAAPATADCTAYSKAFWWDFESKQLFVSGATATPNDYQSFFDVSPILRASTYFFSGPFVFNSISSGAGLKSDFALGSPNQFAEGDRIAIRWRDMDTDGSLSAPQIAVFSVEKVKMFTIQSSLNSGTFAFGAGTHWLNLGSVLMGRTLNPNRGHEPLPVACRLRHMAVHINLKTRVDNPPLVQIFTGLNTGLGFHFSIPGSDQSDVQINYTESDIVGWHYSKDDWYSAFAFIDTTPGMSLPFSQCVVTAYFEIGDFS